MLSVKLLSMVMMLLLSILSVIRHQIMCNLNWILPNLNLIYETSWNGVKSGILISILGKLSWFGLTGPITVVLLMWKWMGLVLRKNHLLRYWGWLSLLNWIGALTLSLLLKLPPRKMELFYFVLWRFFLLKLLCISINLPYSLCMEYCCHVWAGSPSCYLELLGKLQKQICRTVGRLLADSLEPLAHRQNVASSSLFYRDYFSRCSCQNWFHFLFLKVDLLVIMIDYLIFLSPFLDVPRMAMSTVSFLAQLGSGILCL